MPSTEVREDGRCLARCFWNWVDTPMDMMWADDGKDVEGTPGGVLYVSDLEASQPGAIWKLRGQLPNHRYIVGLDDAYRVHAPKGVPKEWESFFSSVASV